MLNIFFDKFEHDRELRKKNKTKKKHHHDFHQGRLY